MKKILLVILFFSFNISTFAIAIECPVLKKDNTVELELKKSESFENCFSLSDIDENKVIQYISWSKDAVLNKVVLFEINDDGSSTYIAEYLSDENASNVFRTNTADRSIAFKIIPTSFLMTNKNVVISYLDVNGVVQIMVNIDELPDDPSEVRPPRTGGCYFVNGTRVCNNEL